MPYNPNTGKITVRFEGQTLLGVDFSDIMQAVGCNVADLGYLIEHGTINPWAKYKPVRYSSKDTSDQWDFTNLRWKYPSELPTGVTPWWRGTSGMIAGITPYRIQTSILNATNIGTLIAVYDDGMNGWTYTRPAINGSFPFRDTDFALYNAKAMPPVQNFVVKETIPYDSQASGGGGKITADAMYFLANDESYDCITLADLTNYNFSGLYFGIIIVRKTDNTPMLIATSESTLSPRIERTLGNNGTSLQKGEYDVYPIFSSVSMFQMLPFTNAQPLYLYTAPMCPILQTQVVDKDYTVDVTIECRPNLTTGTSGTFTVYNDTSANVTNLKYALSTSPSSPSTYTDWSTGTTVNANSSKSMLGVSFGNNTYFHITFNWASQPYVYHLYQIIPQVTPIR